MRCHISGLVAILLLLCGCSDLDLQKSGQCLVLEGWIEDGGFPVVLLTTSVPVSTEKQNLDSLAKHIVRWGKVTISDGEKECVMTGGMDTRFIPPYSYTTARMRGVAGKQYTVVAEYAGMSATAVTTIPEPKKLEYLRVESVGPADTSFRIVAGLKDDRTTVDYYRFFVRKNGIDSTFYSSFLGLVSDDILSAEVDEVPVYNCMTVTDTLYRQEFGSGDIVDVRFSTLDSNSWEYWSDFDAIQSLSMNPFFPVHKKIRSNVSSGMGYWAGYGSSYYRVSIADSLALGRVWPAAD